MGQCNGCGSVRNDVNSTHTWDLERALYAEFECLLKEVDSGIHYDCFSYSAKYQYHIPCSFA